MVGTPFFTFVGIENLHRTWHNDPFMLVPVLHVSYSSLRCSFSLFGSFGNGC